MWTPTQRDATDTSKHNLLGHLVEFVFDFVFNSFKRVVSEDIPQNAGVLEHITYLLLVRGFSPEGQRLLDGFCLF